jgi:general secretion pathway protein D
VGIDLTVTPYITPDGLVTMEVNQIIEEIAPGAATDTAIPPTTNKREANSTVSVMSGEAILLGGYIRNSRSEGRSGVPFLKDIPLLGKAFSSNSKDGARTELMVMMRPTVLANPKEASEFATKTRNDSAPLRELEYEIKTSEDARRKAVEKKEQRRDSKWWGK